MHTIISEKHSTATLGIDFKGTPIHILHKKLISTRTDKFLRLRKWNNDLQLLTISVVYKNSLGHMFNWITKRLWYTFLLYALVPKQATGFVYFGNLEKVFADCIYGKTPPFLDGDKQLKIEDSSCNHPPIG